MEQRPSRPGTDQQAAEPERDPTFAQKYLRSRVSWTAMAERDAADTEFTYFSYDVHEGRPLRNDPFGSF